jgi:hypothetical protein
MYNDPEAVYYAQDSLGLAKAAFSSGALKKGSDHLDHAGESGSADDMIVALHMKAAAAAKLKNYKQASGFWLKIMEQTGDDSYAALALAKYYEHKIKDYDTALNYALLTALSEGEEASGHRQKRLLKKKERS